MVYRRHAWTVRPRVAHEGERPKRSKLNVRIDEQGKLERTYRGIRFKSKAERRYAELLDLRVSAGEVKGWAYEPRRFPLLAFSPEGRPIKIGVYTPDFYLTFPDGSTEYVEVKGRSSTDYRLRARMFAACYPEERWREVSAKDF